MDTDVVLNWNITKDEPKIIKVIGIGGGGVNAVNYMYESGIRGVNFAVCNTDRQSLNDINVPNRVVLGDGLGSGGKPHVAEQEFEKSREEVEKLLDDGTEMIFLASGMGGGTGSGAGPLLAKMAKDKGILTVGIVTIPFLFEMVPRVIKGLKAVKKMRENVDALIVINNEKLYECYPDSTVAVAFEMSNEVLAMAVKSIAEIISVKGIINRDFNDVKSTMKNSGVALVSYGFGAGTNRLDDAVQAALHSPLLSKNDIFNARRLLFYVTCRKEKDFETQELKYMKSFMKKFDNHIEVIWGYGYDESLTTENEMKFTIIATGFGMEAIPEIEKWQKEMEMQDIADENELMEEFYGQNFNTGINVKRVSQSSIVILTMEEMDNDAFLNFLEEKPTYSRLLREIEDNRIPQKVSVKKEDKISSDANEASDGKMLIEW